MLDKPLGVHRMGQVIDFTMLDMLDARGADLDPFVDILQGIPLVFPLGFQALP
jgi:hypothetical protein